MKDGFIDTRLFVAIQTSQSSDKGGARLNKSIVMRTWPVYDKDVEQCRGWTRSTKNLHISCTRKAQKTKQDAHAKPVASFVYTW